MTDNQQTPVRSAMFVNARLIEAAFDCLVTGEVKRDTPHGELLWQQAMVLRGDILAQEPVSPADALILIQLGRDSASILQHLAETTEPDNERDMERMASLAQEVSAVFAKLENLIERTSGTSLHALGLDLVGITRQ